ncbi:MAG: polymerase III subunit beta protein [Candidatus Daviesbacteria bacterium GW2011_GWA2_38_24]|uniref:Beta sliding clamp n=1 Tax=Candidatus Daviesbacteria bacterium GW2011_GWA2_38_24 TaxID=1618422 RepID=A0A0G0LZU3_9BACT|nr:MAG: polymerase III subunit beta protein [Candidatus Daviesbacteria bacterium GW2011_GWA2_38_24]OGE24053.1 MAG: DNA polymerase III subunit beta [Candidatus Daviesbacteria bacterium RIFCSPHIGHO2_01_FULL_38_8]
MKINILQQDLLPGLQAVSRSCGVKSSLPVLANILLQAENDKLKLSATNLEIGVIKEINAQVIEEGELTVPAKTLVDVVSSLSGAEITLEASGEQLKISTPHFNALLNGISATEFPSIPLSSDKSITVSGKDVHISLPQVSFAAASDEGRPILTGILTEIKNDNLELVATDGFRLAHKKTTLSGTNGANFKALIPRRTFEELIRLVSEEIGSKEVDQMLEVSTSENQNQIIFKVGNTKLSSRLIEGNFPAWEKIIPTTMVSSAVIDRTSLLKAVKLAAVFAKSDTANIVKLELKDGKLRLTSEAKELGGQESDIEAKTEGIGLLIAFNSKFLIDALQNSNADDVQIEFSGNLSPALIRPVGEEGLEYVVMPVRLS